MKYPAIVDDFSSGEIDPLLLGKVNAEELKKGLLECINLEPTSKGALLGRQGFRHLQEFESTDQSASLYPFLTSSGNLYLIIFMHDIINIYDAETETLTTEEYETDPSYPLPGVDHAYTAEELHGADRDRHNISCTQDPLGVRMVACHPDRNPFALEVSDLYGLSVTWVGTSFICTETAPGTYTYSDWGPASGGLYPEQLTFLQGRSWWVTREKIHASKSGEDPIFYDPLWWIVGFNGGSADDDAASYTKQWRGDQKWISGHKDLLLGSEEGEYVISAENGVITPSDIQIDPQSAYGSKRVDPVYLGDEVLYVSADGRKIRSMWWRWIESGWKSVDLTYSGEHLTYPGIKNIEYVRDPESVVWVHKSDSSIAQCFYRRKNDNRLAVGWNQVEPGEGLGDIVGLCSARIAGKTKIYAMVSTEVDGVDKLHLMVQDQNDVRHETTVYLDNYIMVEPTTETVSGLDHLEGQTVHAIGDGAYLGEFTVSGNEITVDGVYDVVYVGHKYRQRLETMPYNIYEEGLAYNTVKRWNKILTKLYKSGPPLINGKRVDDRSVETAMDTAEPLITGMVNIGNKGWDRDGTVVIEQDLPLPLNVLGIFGEISFESI